jgi:hypothetical protein
MSLSKDTIEQVWKKGAAVQSFNPTMWRKDQCGAWISRNEYGNRKSPYGWEIDHITPRSQGGSDHLSNLRPLQWENNVRKQSGRLGCAVTAYSRLNFRIQ